MPYESITLKQEIIIDNIISIHYFEYMSDFIFEGESHNFWEFLCVDKGVVEVTAGARQYTLNRGDIIFHKPNEFHAVAANGVVAPNLVVIGFECSSPAMNYFRDRLMTFGMPQRQLLANIIKEARAAYACRLDDPYCQKLIRRNEVPFGAEQFIKMYLQLFLLQLIRSGNAKAADPLPLPAMTRHKNEDDLFERILLYMEKNIGTPLTIEQICKDNLVGRSILQKLFRDHSGCGVIDYFSSMKIAAAKQMIRDKHLNFTQIADELGYNSIHYFSRQFKKIAGMTPSEYASSIKLLSEAPQPYIEHEFNKEQ